MDKQAAKISLLKKHMVEAEKKLAAKEEELKANEVELLAKAEELEKALTEVAQLRGELTRLLEKVPLLRAQLDQAKIDTARAIPEFQASEEMAAIKKSIHDARFEAGVPAFTYTVATEHHDWDLAFLGEELSAQVVA